jgi:heme-degrading monooxygenase HmoA
MYARANMMKADPAKIDEGIRHVQDTVLPAVQAVAGNRGMAMAVDRQTGAGAVVTFWEDLDALRASEDSVAPMREESSRMLGGTLEPHILEVVEQHIRETPTPGCWNRVTMLEASAEDLDQTAEVFRTSTIPALDAMEGFCAALLHFDREAGRGVAVTTWRDRASMEASRERASGLRQEVADKSHGTVAAVDEQEIVLFSITGG